MELTERHWEKAAEIVEEVTKDNAFVISSAMIANVDSQSGLNQLILQTIKNSGGKAHVSRLRGELIRKGSDPARYDATIKQLLDSGAIRFDTDQGQPCIELLCNPDSYL